MARTSGLMAELIANVATAPLTASVVTEPMIAEGLRAEWHELLGHSDSDEPMLSPIWLLNWWRIWGSVDGRQLRLVLASHADEHRIRTDLDKSIAPFRRKLVEGRREAYGFA